MSENTDQVKAKAKLGEAKEKGEEVVETAQDKVAQIVDKIKGSGRPRS